MGKMAADPNGAALTTPNGLALLPMREWEPVWTTGWDGRKGAR
jgi:hypothetical protein